MIVINLSCFGSLSLAKHQIYPCWRKGICPVLLIPEERRIKIDEKEKRRLYIMDDCRPLGFLIGLPFALIALVLSLIGAVVWVIGSVLSCLCPCCICCAGLANLAVSLVKLPVNVIRWFIDLIPC
ncbi:signaling peptide TAXIMIN 2-like [Populus alba]|uniref:signaling peptide TAXIMIN 2-like n=1 Tax=Populus alba TaxID=43335 RepID=UPI00158857D6|nr:signaling peptide TAXIMIN 2-like [Populus alba]